MSEKIGSFYEEDIRAWEKLPLVSSVLTSAHFGAWLYFRDKRKDARIRAEVIDEIVKKIESEISNSSQTQYVCEDGEIISTDVGYVEEWFENYKWKLKEQKPIKAKKDFDLFEWFCNHPPKYLKEQNK